MRAQLRELRFSLVDAAIFLGDDDRDSRLDSSYSARVGRRTPTAARLHFWLKTPMLPLALVQGKRARQRIPKMPEAGGERTGTVGEGTSFSLAVLGESTAVGVGTKTQEEALAFALARFLARERGASVRVQAVGKNGATLEKIRVSFAQKIVLPVDAVVVVMGVNDTLQLTRGTKWSNEIGALIADLRARGTRRVMFSPVPPLGTFASLPAPLRGFVGARASYLDALLEDACRKGGAHYLATAFPAGEAFMADDGFHPSAAGYEAWAEALVRAWPLDSKS